MLRPMNLLVIGLAFMAGSAVTWYGGRRSQDSAASMQNYLTQMQKRDESILHDLQGLRQEVRVLPTQITDPAAGKEDPRQWSDLKRRAEEAELVARALQTRIEDLARKLHEKDLILDKLTNQKGIALAGYLVAESNAPAAEALRGKITKIEPSDISLVEVNLGKEQGLEKGHTLDVFRGAGPRPEYLGMLRILEAYGQRAICRLVSSNPLKKQALQVGDRVAGSGR
jgi:hypothetical protein